MIVPVTVPPANSFSPKLVPPIAKLGHEELFLIELQGVLDVRCPESTSNDGQLIGTLNMTDTNKPTLKIGNHLLEGKVVSLPKPLGVLQKQVRHAVLSAAQDGDETGDADGEKEREGNRQVRWDVAAVVRKKIVFSRRPMPISKTKPASTVK